MGWRERHFVLSTTKLTYFTHPSKSAPKGSISLDSIKCINPLPDKKHGKRFCMAIITTTVTWIVRADTEADFQRWTDAIIAAIDSLHKRSVIQNRTFEAGGDIRIPPISIEAATDFGDDKQSALADSQRQNTDASGKHHKNNETPSKSSAVPTSHGSDPHTSKEGMATMTPKGSGSLDICRTSEAKVVSSERRVRSTDRRAGERRIEEYYVLGRVIDSGANGRVMEGMERRSGQRVAVKQVDLGQVVENEHQMDIWQQVQHENVVRLLDFFRDDAHKSLYFVMELATGRDLFYGVMQHYEGDTPRGFSEGDAMEITHQVLTHPVQCRARRLVRREIAARAIPADDPPHPSRPRAQVLTALRHLHLRRIVHCDLKPENILIHAAPDGRPRIKLADWGFAQTLSDRPLTRVLGTGGSASSPFPPSPPSPTPRHPRPPHAAPSYPRPPDLFCCINVVAPPARRPVLGVPVELKPA